MSFGFVTAVSEARAAIYAAHTEAQGARNGIGLVKLMGRESGFIAAFASITNGDVNFCLIPEMRFSMEKLLEALKERLESRRHAVLVVGEGAGQDLIAATGTPLPQSFVRWVIRHEWVATLDDLIERRLMLLYDPHVSGATLEELARLLVESGRLAAANLQQAVSATCRRLQDHFGKRLADAGASAGNILEK